MTDVIVENLIFSFPDNWNILKYDDCCFYRNCLSKATNGIKAVDLIAVDDSKNAWLIEVKDYKNHSRTKTIAIQEEITLKVIYTLAAMIPCRINAESALEKDISKKVCSCSKLKIVLHIEQPTRRSKITPRPIDPANLKIKLRKALSAITRYPLIVSIEQPANVGWSVSRV